LIALRSARPVSAGSAEAAASTSYPSTGSISGSIITITIPGGKEFIGWWSGIGNPGPLVGYVYTDNINELYQYTTQYSLTATAVFVSVIFYNAQNQVLGNFESGTVSIVAGTGAGTGSWRTAAEKPAKAKPIFSPELLALLKPTPQMIASDYVNFAHGRMDAKLIEENAKKLIALRSARPVSAGSAEAAASTSYPATGSIASLLFGMHLTCTITGGKEFSGWSGGIATPGGGWADGDVYTDNINELYQYTTQYSFVATAVYLNIIWYNAQNQVLGNFESGTVSIVAGTGAGTGSWS